MAKQAAERPDFRGVVTRSNQNGVQLDGVDGWINISRFHEPRPLAPPVGAMVELWLDSSNYITRIDVEKLPPGYSVNAHVDPTPRSTRAMQPQPAVPTRTTTTKLSPVKDGWPQPSQRDILIARMSVLKVAADCAIAGTAEGEAPALGDVLFYAESLEQWVLRSSNPDLPPVAPPPVAEADEDEDDDEDVELPYDEDDDEDDAPPVPPRAIRSRRAAVVVQPDPTPSPPPARTRKPAAVVTPPTKPAASRSRAARA